MIIYATQKTIERYHILLPEKMSSPIKEITLYTIEKEKGDRLLEWGMKIFYFDGRKCLQIVNYASKLTLFLFDVKMNDFADAANAMANYMIDLYNDNVAMKKLLERFFSEYPIAVFDKIQNKSIIATLNHTQTSFAFDGYRFYDFIEGNILKTKKINRVVNYNWLFSEKINGKKQYFFSGARFEELLRERYGI